MYVAGEYLVEVNRDEGSGVECGFVSVRGDECASRDVSPWDEAEVGGINPRESSIEVHWCPLRVLGK